jgi:hypothetical protein
MMKPLRHAPLVVALLATAALSWVLITRASDRTRWLQVEMPTQIVSGGRAQVTLTLEAPPPAGLLCADLHWKNARKESRSTLSTSRPQAIRAGQTTYRFDLPVPSRPGLAYVYGVIYVTPTGQWRDRTRACTTDPVAVSATLNPASASQQQVIAAHDQPLGPPPKRQDSQLVRWTSALLWALTGILCWSLRLRLPDTDAGPVNLLARRWAWLALACILAAAWEASAAESGLGDWLRRMAISRGWYDDRRRLQEVLTAIVFAVSLLVALVALRRDHAQPISLVFSSADTYWGMSAISFISLHDADAWLATPVLTIPVAQIVKLAAAAVAASGAARAASFPNADAGSS